MATAHLALRGSTWLGAELHRVRERLGPRALAGALSLLCNVGFLVLLFRQEVTPDARLLSDEHTPVSITATSAGPRTDSPPRSSPATAESLEEFATGATLSNATPPPLLEIDDAEPPAPTANSAPANSEPAGASEPVEGSALAADMPSPSTELPQPRQIDMAPAQQTMLTQRMVAAAQTLQSAPSTAITWSQDGQTYRATLTRQSASDSMGLESIIADITAAGADGSQLQTQLTVQRLAFSQFTQVVDYWDPNVQLHDDEIVGRFHSNSPFAIADDGEAAPKFFGKVTTAARALTFATSGSRRRGQMFQGGLQTRAGRIDLPDRAQPFPVAPEQDSYVHSFSDDTHIILNADGSYTWQARKAPRPEQRRYPHDRPSYFLAAPGARLFVRGVVNGKVLVYSPAGIVIEGSLIYADNPRSTVDASDYLGLVSDRNVEVAPPYVTGRGDLNIHAAIFARRRFVVSSIDYRRTATLFIYGSLTVGSISATEPRYATKLEFDPRFDRVRPPGFPSTNRYEVGEWSATWREMSAPGTP